MQCLRVPGGRLRGDTAGQGGDPRAAAGHQRAHRARRNRGLPPQSPRAADHVRRPPSLLGGTPRPACYTFTPCTELRKDTADGLGCMWNFQGKFCHASIAAAFHPEVLMCENAGMGALSGSRQCLSACRPCDGSTVLFRVYSLPECTGACRDFPSRKATLWKQPPTDTGAWFLRLAQMPNHAHYRVQLLGFATMHFFHFRVHGSVFTFRGSETLRAGSRARTGWRCGWRATTSAAARARAWALRCSSCWSACQASRSRASPPSSAPW